MLETILFYLMIPCGDPAICDYRPTGITYSDHPSCFAEAERRGGEGWCAATGDADHAAVISGQGYVMNTTSDFGMMLMDECQSRGLAGKCRWKGPLMIHPDGTRRGIVNPDIAIKMGLIQ